ncbi:Molybdopterin molybdenumtransferase-like protein [Cladobotryum mycophilum]|uniref:molybdopterin adenylyltransferase n=1 Tax=Cladobotryum mycophilum TaxID=491253 RepID=A0ABR0S652_9HYPO
MATSYESALAMLGSAAHHVQASRSSIEPAREELVTLDQAVGHVAACDCLSPRSTPEFDTSATDGYAIHSESTRWASPRSPVFFKVYDPDLANVHNGEEICIEIMAGARFPEPYGHQLLDACVKFEDVAKAKGPDGYYWIAITKSVPSNANRRFAGEDIRVGELLLKAGHVVSSSHLLPLASVGIQGIRVVRRPRIAIWSTGAELLSENNYHARDVNGLFLTTCSREAGATATFLGVLGDNVESMAHAFSMLTKESQTPDVLITTGGVSAGKFDFVPKALCMTGAQIMFHGIAMRPGHPILFALLPSSCGEIAFFGLPGSPGAAAACFRLLVVPYLRYLLGQEPECPVYARLDCPNYFVHPAQDQERFRLGIVQRTADGKSFVKEVEKHRGSTHLSPFLHANCWMRFKRQQRHVKGDDMECFPLHDKGG